MTVNAYPDAVTFKMDRAVSYARLALLPETRALQSFNQFRNISTYSDEQLASYVEAFYFDKFLITFQVQSGLATAGLLGIFGQIGTILAIAVLFREKEFNTPSWTYHRFIQVVELISLPFNTYVAFATAVPARYRSWLVMQLVFFVSTPTSKVTRTAIDTMVLFMTIERTFALWLPRAFHHVNNKKVATCLCTLSILVSLVTVSDYWSLDLMVGAFGEISAIPSAAASTQPYLVAKAISNILVLIDAFGTLTATIAVTAGMIRRQRFRKRAAPGSDEKREARRTVQVSLLCLTCALPMVTHWVLYFIYIYFLFPSPSGDAAVSKLPYETAMYSLGLLMASRFVVMAFVLFASINHCGHFFFYYAFNPTFRSKARQLLLAAKNSKVHTFNSTTMPAQQKLQTQNRESLALAQVQ